MPPPPGGGLGWGQQTIRNATSCNHKITPIVRELKILKEIAVQHELEDVFNELLASTKLHKQKPSKRGRFGFMLTHSIRFDGTEMGIHNIFDASLAVPFVEHTYQWFSIARLWEMVINTFYFMKNRRSVYKEELPSI